MPPTSGAAKAMHVTAQLGRTQSWRRQRRGGSSRRLLCYWTWPNSTNVSGTTTSGTKVREPVFQRDSWLVGALHTKAGVFSRPTKCATLPFCGLWDHSSRLQWGHNRCQTHAGNSPGNSGHTSPDPQVLECGRQHFGARGGTPQDGASPHPPKRQGFWWKASRRATFPFPRANPKSSSTARTSSSRPFCSSWRCSGSTSATRHATPVVKRWLARAAKRTKRVRQLRKAGAHARNLTLTGSNAGVLWGSEALGFTPTQLQSIKVDAAKATYRLSRGQNAATTMLANAKAAGSKKHRSGLSTSSTSHFGLGDGSLGRHSRPRHHAGCAVRLPGQAQSTQAAVVRRHGRSGHLCAHALAAGMEASLSWSDNSAHWNQSKGPLFWEAPSDHSLFLASWRVGHSGIGTCWSSWSREAFGPRKGLRGSRARTTAAASRHHVPPLLRVPGRKRYARLSGAAPGGTFSGNSTQGTVCTRHFS